MASQVKMFAFYDPNAGLEFYETIEEARKEAEAALDSYREVAITDGWEEPDVAEVCILQVVERSTQVDRVDRPDDVDEEGYSESLDEYWCGDFEYRCNFALRPVGGDSD